ncbi:SUMF1/EgtB/PvdO family nonheme iron enzyme [Pyxidicoccus fallax]|uniref:Formylglycine-generating enzyme family protein n=1 Tax=Pyxidicoccus fallax TaxID=394095 RepID=A0A848LIH7_9BACT|nr:SUMF1/EgtB/PvdO family nonheme iron enzyme [Pyxidicoccus fallax]NMO17524.1 formylglycine-generating enzyme family protein [Pyxidicoccus fallax]NPC81541.1 SUMF1/EgtB/PvdO family nonheme iron enzyme [Pyxidicoccus fallax]
MLTLLLTVSLAAAPAPSPANAVIWASARTEAEGQTLLAKWSNEAPVWSERLRFKPGYPKLVKSDTLPGLNPGFHVVLLGLCNAEQVRPRVRAIKEVYPQAYWRPVKVAAEDSCPELLCGASDAMAVIPPGEFTAGCTYSQGSLICSYRDVESRPSLPGFELDRTEVTERAYAACVEQKVCKAMERLSYDGPGGPDHPALVTFGQAWAYCAWQGKRLVRSLEWEKAARGTDGRRFPWGGRPADCSLAHFDECGKGTRPVGGFPLGSSPYGVLDLMGNVHEWVDGEPLEDVLPDGTRAKSFPIRGRVGDPATYALWQQETAYSSLRNGFRCARSCTWPEGKPLPPLPPPMDTAPQVPFAYEQLADPKLRDALEQWRTAREAELGQGAKVEWTERNAYEYGFVYGFVREHRGAECLEGPINFVVQRGEAGISVRRNTGGAVACCPGATCARVPPQGYALRFVQALIAKDVEAMKAFLPARGKLVYRLHYNDDPEQVTKLTRDRFTREDLERFTYVRRDALRCAEDFDEKGEAVCSGGQTDKTSLTLKKTPNGVVVTEVVQHVTEGC